jgi:hypothetical protein
MPMYYAGPLFNEVELRFNAALTAKLEQLGFEVFCHSAKVLNSIDFLHKYPFSRFKVRPGQHLGAFVQEV